MPHAENTTRPSATPGYARACETNAGAALAYDWRGEESAGSIMCEESQSMSRDLWWLQQAPKLRRHLRSVRQKGAADATPVATTRATRHDIAAGRSASPALRLGAGLHHVGNKDSSIWLRDTTDVANAAYRSPESVPALAA
ncbi:hypothetical protein CPLU01_03318 [Colletotrichum plurivorum]|uniref:Uncharacterized protein n=1 Tax=Colletotrichum plurivorum TaxID=2175906 RepID=A0A8H6KSP2_9PEZI|nr:hypothetical protein CPLU01_03318 [Colletotrichum plurivorum]